MCFPITSSSPIQLAASLLSLPDVQCNQLHLCYHLQMSSTTSCISYHNQMLGETWWIPSLTARSSVQLDVDVVHGVTSRICDSTCQWLPIHSLLCGNQWQTECLPLNSVPAKHQMSGATRSSLKCCMMFMVLYTSRSTIYSWYLTNAHNPAATLYSSSDYFLAQISYSDS